MDRGPWRATVHGIAKAQLRLTRLSMHTYAFKQSLLYILDFNMDILQVISIVHCRF